MELKDTIDLMTSDDYKDRFKAEYRQTMIRYSKLYTMLHDWKNGTLEFTPRCPMELYEKQLKAMEDYIQVLVKRAELENIKL